MSHILRYNIRNLSIGIIRGPLERQSIDIGNEINRTWSSAVSILIAIPTGSR
eukprot:CAMPEP_0202694546 /NCGR_PEP_ID=MMETSP1385-20130828/8383_1 /ASSEMBLY_ACC=CAM_ASM_000861 /TAXON_ID=933848 /ORGANISM="Elphidium margaritaceum" /LENGTH=51 /DNA_ID=CAMNT_0049350415 /DNA_START=35 /DNA_END=190 /DNA_ORIENTATION=+